MGLEAEIYKKVKFLNCNKMRTYNVYFYNPLMWGEFDFWRILIEYFVEEADSIRIDCWNEEENIINEILPFSSSEKPLNKYYTTLSMKRKDLNFQLLV